MTRTSRISKRVTAVDLFSGAGGMSLGAHWAGIKIISAVDSDPWAAATYKANFPKSKFLECDIRDVKGDALAQNQEIDVVFGGPPCQGFSTSNQRTRNSSNQNNWLFLEFIRITSELAPKYVVFENVRGLKETESGKFFDEVLTAFSSLGYDVAYWLLNASDYSVPQNRERIFIIATKTRLPIEPQPTTSGKKVTVKLAISDLPFLENGASVCERSYRHNRLNSYTRLMRSNSNTCRNNLTSKSSELILQRYQHVPPGGNWEDIPSPLMHNYKDRSRCHSGVYHRLRADRVSTVVGNFRKNMLIHPTEDRGLSVREAARLQSFPDSFVFQGSIGFQQQQVGNAVPPLLAKSVFESISAVI